MNSQLPNAREQASAILQPWGSNNLALLDRNLAAAMDVPHLVADSGEGERLEMLAAIAVDMRQLLRSGQLWKAQQHLSLLRHLAYLPVTVREYTYCC